MIRSEIECTCGNQIHYSAFSCFFLLLLILNLFFCWFLLAAVSFNRLFDVVPHRCSSLLWKYAHGHFFASSSGVDSTAFSSLVHLSLSSLLTSIILLLIFRVLGFSLLLFAHVAFSLSFLWLPHVSSACIFCVLPFSHQRTLIWELPVGSISASPRSPSPTRSAAPRQTETEGEGAREWDEETRRPTRHIMFLFLSSLINGR